MITKRDIKLWYHINAIPATNQLLEKIKLFLQTKLFGLKKWSYINNVSIALLLDWLEREKSNSDTYIYHDSIVRLHYPLRLDVGTVIMTKHGIGQVLCPIYDLNKRLIKVEIIMMTYNYHKSKGYTKHFHIHDIYQLVVYHKPSMQYILLTPMDYQYINDENQRINYRITNRKYAKLSPQYKAEVEHIKIFNKHRNGAYILSQLSKKGYRIQKQ